MDLNNLKLNSEPEVLAFLSRLSLASNDELDAILETAISFERELRFLFAKEPQHPRLLFRFVGLIDLFDIANYDQVLTARPPAIHSADDEDTRNERFIFPLPAEKRLAPGSPITIESFPAFLDCWSVFSNDSLKDINWNNVVVAGGSIMACASPVPLEIRKSKVSLRAHFQRKEYASSDIDLFLWGVSQSEVSSVVWTCAMWFDHLFHRRRR